jgi:hypothetical protein
VATEGSALYMLISVQNSLPDLPTTQFSYLSSSISSGGTSLPVKNINPYSADSAVQLGKTGESQSEIKIVSGVPATGTANLSAALTYDHSLDTPVFDIHFDQIIFKRSTSGTAGTASAIGTVNITPNSDFTDYDDTTGQSTYAYKTQFKNSVSGDLSSESDWFVPGGPSFYSLQALRGRMKEALTNANYIKGDETIDDWINEWVEQMTNGAIKVNQGYSIGTVDIAFGTSGIATITSNDFKTANKIEVSYSGVEFTRSREVPLNRFSTGDFFSSGAPIHSWQGDTTFVVNPAGDGTARVTFSRLATRLVDDSDELPLSLRSYTTSCVEYCLYRAFDNDQKRDYATDHYGKFSSSKQDFISEITPRDQTGPKVIDLTESLSGDDTESGFDYF